MLFAGFSALFEILYDARIPMVTIIKAKAKTNTSADMGLTR